MPASRLIITLFFLACLTYVMGASSAAAAKSSSPAADTPAKTTAAAAASTSVPPLISYHFTYPDVPYQVDPYATGRGPQSGYNLCNSTTEGPKSNCQTSWLNSISDFCLWGPTEPNSTIGVTEAATVAWCTTNTHGARVIPQGALQGVQFLRAPAYIQVTGLIDQTFVDMQAGDEGGEMDPHGADLRGNPLGGLVFSSGFTSSNGAIVQVVEWNNFMGSNIFCFKACDPSVANSTAYCENIYDTEGCNYNMPAAYAPGVFESCLSDNQDPAGTTPTSVNPPIPSSSSCTTYTSSLIYTLMPTAAATPVASPDTPDAGPATTSAAQPSTSSSSANAIAYDGHIGLMTIAAGAFVLGALAVFA